MSKKISEDELEKLFVTGKTKSPFGIFQIAKYILIFLFIFSFVYGLLNYQAIWQKIKYWYSDEFTDVSRMNSTDYVNTITSDPENKTNFPTMADNSIFIPAINVSAPVSWRVENNAATVATELKKGTIHLAGTALPGEIGNVFITGHSSNLPWVKSSYNSIFALLDKLVVGDIVYLKYQNNVYIYKISNTKTVSPNETSVLNSTDQSILTLMTCTPTGTSLKRLIATADQIYPDSTSNTSRTETKNQALPDISR